MKPPRYLLREYVLKKILQRFPPGKFLEIGYGNGKVLEMLAQLGYRGHGYDFSSEAFQAANQLLKQKKINDINLLLQMDPDQAYDYIFFLEVIGYFASPVDELKRYARQLEPQGKIVFSFVNKKARYSQFAVGDMQRWSRLEMQALLEQAGFRPLSIINYGFPLANLLEPFLNLKHYLAHKMGFYADAIMETKKTGMGHTGWLMTVVGLLINSLTIYPFAKLQMVFQNSSWGNGFIVVAIKT